MKNSIYAVCLLVLISGCSSRETSSTSTEMQKPKEDFIGEGIQLLAKKDGVQAIAKFKEAIAQDPKNAKAHFVLGQTYMSAKEYAKAIESFKAVSELEPTNGEAYLLMGGCNDLLGNKQAAIDDLQKSVSIFQKNRDEANFKRALGILWALSGVKPPTP